MFNQTDQRLIDKPPSSIECAFCIEKKMAFDYTVSQYHTKVKTLVKI